MPTGNWTESFLENFQIIMTMFVERDIAFWLGNNDDLNNSFITSALIKKIS